MRKLFFGLFLVIIPIFVLAQITIPSESLIKKVQKALKDKGYYYGQINGKMNEETKNTLIYYQKIYNLEPTGKPDQATLKKLLPDSFNNSKSIRKQIVMLILFFILAFLAYLYLKSRKTKNLNVMQRQKYFEKKLKKADLLLEQGNLYKAQKLYLKVIKLLEQ